MASTTTTNDSSHLVKQIINIKSKLHKFKNNKTKTCLHKLINKSIPNPNPNTKSECENEYKNEYEYVCECEYVCE